MRIWIPYPKFKKIENGEKLNMDRNYTPDRWALANFVFEDGQEEIKVVGTWYGGYLDGDSWRFSSGVTKIEDAGEFYKIHNNSGSIYMCHKKAKVMEDFVDKVNIGDIVVTDTVSGYGIHRVTDFEANCIRADGVTWIPTYCIVRHATELEKVLYLSSDQREPIWD